MIAKQSAMVDDLTAQMEQLKQVNSQLDYSWGEKYRDMNDTNEADFNRMQKDLNQQLDVERRNNAEKIKQLMTDFQQDM